MANQENAVEKHMKPDEKGTKPFQYWFIFFLIFIVPVVSVSIYFAADSMVGERKERWSRKVAAHMENVVQSKVDAFTFLLNGLGHEVNQLASAESILDFVMEADQSFGSMDVGGNTGDSSYQAILAQVDEFKELHGYTSIYLIDINGRVMAHSSDAPPMVTSQRAAVRRAGKYGQATFSHARMYKKVLTIDVSVPVMTGGNQSKPVAIVSAMVPISKEMKQVFTLKGVVGKSEMLEVFQSHDTKLYRLYSDGQERLASWSKHDEQSTLYGKSWIIEEGDTSQVFSKSQLKWGGEGHMPNDKEVIAVKKRINGSPFIVLYVTGVKEALSFLEEYKRQIHVIAQLITVTFASASVAVWWHLRQRRLQKRVDEYREYAGELEDYKNLLDGVNNTVSEIVTLKTMGGKYTYANPAFCKLVGRAESEILGYTDVVVFGEEQSEILSKMDSDASKARDPIYTEQELYINDKKYLIEMSKTPIKDSIGKYIGIATVARDITEIAKDRKLEEEAHMNVIRSMMSVMERHDSYLYKHTRYLRRLVAALAKRMKMKQADITTVEAVASLCQLGKVFVPKELLRKEHLSGEEELDFQEHVTHMAFILDCVDWSGLPVVKVAYEMYERKDGSGYPNGLRDDQIDSLAAMMAVCDQFSCLVFPAPGKDPMTPEAAIKYLRDRSHQFDINYTAKLAELIVEENEVLLAG